MKDTAARKLATATTSTVWRHSLRRQALWAALTLALGLPAAHAQTTPDGGSHTNVIAAPNGVPVVNIAAPNNAGVSHNTYQQFNVGSNGLIFNNNGAVSNTNLSGYITGNPNLGPGQSAAIILNEVTSTQPSQLNGAMEVAGRAAQVIVANPNGITCGGCGFINAPRGTLVTGVPILDANGGLSGFNVRSGTITVNSQGLLSSETDQVDLLARAVEINAGVWARQLNVVTGSNRVDYTTLAAQPIAATGATPAVALDVSALGGMYANAIRLLGTEAGLGVNSQGQIAAQSGDLSLTSAGQVVLGGKTTASGNLSVQAAQALSNQGTLAAGGAVNISSADLNNSGVLYSGSAMNLSANGQLSNSGQIKAQNGALTAQAAGALNNTATGSIYTGGAINLSGASFGNAGAIETAQSASVQTGGHADNSGILQTDAGDLLIQANSLGNSGSLSANGNATLNATSALSSTGTSIASRNLTLSSAQLTTAGTVQAGAALSLQGGTLSNSGKLYALGGAWTATLSGAFADQSGGDVHANQNLALNAASLTNAGSIEAQQGNAINLDGALINSGKLQSDQSDVTLVASSLSNGGTLSAYRNLQAQLSGTAQNSGVLVTGQAINLSSTSFDNQANGQIQSGTDLNLSAATQSNEGSVNAKGNATLAGADLSNANGAQWMAAGTLTLNQTGNVSNAGLLQAGGDLSMLHAASLANSGTFNTTGNAVLTASSSLSSTGTLLASGSVNLTAPQLVTAGIVQAGSALTLSGGTLSNNGKLYALGGAWAATLTGAATSQSAGDIYGSQNLVLNAASLTNAGSLEAQQGNAIKLGGALINSGKLQSDQADLTLIASSLSNSGTLSAYHNLQAQLGGTAQNSGVLVTGQAINLSSSTFDNQANGQIQSGTDLNLSAATQSNEGSINVKGNAALTGSDLSNANGAQWMAAGTFTLNQGGNVSNAGLLQAAGDLSMLHAASLTNSGIFQNGTGSLTLTTGTLANTGTLSTNGSAVLNASSSLSSTGTLLAVGNLSMTAQQLNTAGTVQAGSALSLSGGTLSNNGKLYALGGAWTATLTGAFTSQSNGDVYGSQALGIKAASLTNAGSIEAQQANTLTLDGALTNSGKLQSDQADITLNAATLANAGTLSAYRNLQAQLSSTAQNSGVLVTGQAINLSSSSFDNQASGQIQSGTDLNLSAATLNNEGAVNVKGNATLSGTTLTNANGAQWIAAGTLTLNQTGNVSNAGLLQAAGDLAMRHAAALTNSGTLQNGSGNLTLTTGVLGNSGILSTNGSAVLNASNSLTSTGVLQAGGNLSLTAPQLTTAGAVQAGGALSLSGGTLSNDGKLYALGGAWTAMLTGAAISQSNGDIYGSQGLAITAASLTNAGSIEAKQADAVQLGDAFANSGKLQSDQANVSINAATLANTGTLSAYGNLQAQLSSTAQNSGVLVTGQAINLTATSFDNQSGGQLQSGGDLALSAPTLSNEGSINAKGNTTLAGTDLSNASGAQWIASGTFTLGQTGSVSNAGVLQAGSDLVMTHAASLDNATGGTLYAGQDFNLSLTRALTNGGMLYAARTATFMAGSVNNTGTLRSAGMLTLSSNGKLVSSGAIQAQQNLSLQSASDFANSGELYAINGSLSAQVGGVFSSAMGGDIYSGQNVTFNANSFANAGTLEAKQAIGLTAQGGVSNSGTLQADNGNLVVSGSSLANQGTLSATGATQLSSTGNLSNSGKLVTGQTLALTGAGVTNSGQIQSGSNATLQAANVTNSGSLQAGGKLAFQRNATLTNQTGGSILAAGDLSTDTATLLDNAGVIQGGGNLSIIGTGAVDNEAGGTLYGTQLTTLQLGGALSNAGTLYGAQGFNLTAASLTSTGSLRSGTSLSITTQGSASNSGNAYALGNAIWNIGGAFTNNGVLAASGNTTLTAGSLGGNGTLAAGLQGNGTLGSSGDLTLTTSGNLANHGHALAAGHLSLTGSAIDLSNSQMRASSITLKATQGDINNTGGDLAANGLVSITTPGSLINLGASSSQVAKLSAGTLVLQAAALNNQYGSLVQSGSSDLNLSFTGAFENAGGTLATNAQNLSINAASIDNTSGTLQAAGNGMLDLVTSGDLTNTHGKIAGNGALTLQSNGTLGNNGGQLSAAGNITTKANAFSNVVGTLIGNNVGLTIAQALTNTGGGTIQAGGALSATANKLDNSGGFIKLTDAQALSLATTGTLTNGAGGFIGGNGVVNVNSGSLINTGQIYAGNTLGVTAQGNLVNDNGAMQAQASATLTSGGALSNRAGKIEAGSGNSSATLNVNAASLDNTSGRIADTGQGASAISVAQNLGNEGGTLGGQGAVTLSAANLDNNNAGKLVAGQALALYLGGMSNVGGSVYAAGDINWNNGGATLQNTQGSLQTGGNLSFALASVANANGTLASNGNSNFNLGQLTGMGKVAAGQSLSLSLGGDFTNVAGSQLSAGNDLTLNVGGNFSNAAGATLQAPNNLTVTAANIDNATGATFISNGTTTLSTGGTLSNEGNINGNIITLNAGVLTNTANIIGGTITATAGSLTNGADLGQTTSNNPYQGAMIAGSNSVALYVGGTLLNRDATIFTTGDITIAANTAGGASQAVTNLSGDIEANGSVSINTNQFTNQRRVFQTTTYNLTAGEQAQNTNTGSPQAAYRYDDTDPTHRPPYVAASQVLTQAQQNALESFCGGQGTPGKDGDQWCNGSAINGDAHNILHNDLQSITTATLTAVQRLAAASAQSKLLAGGNITLNGSVLNDKSTIGAGNNLTINGQNGNNGGGGTSNATVQNIAFTPTGTLSESINEQTGIEYVSFSGGRHWAFKDYETWGTYQASVQTGLGSNQPGWITYNAGPGLAATMSAGNTVAITGQTITNTNVGADGKPVQQVLGLGGNSAGQAVGGSAAATVGSASGTGGSVGNIAIGNLPGQASGSSLGLAGARSVDLGSGLKAPGQAQDLAPGTASAPGAGSGSNLQAGTGVALGTASGRNASSSSLQSAGQGTAPGTAGAHNVGTATTPSTSSASLAPPQVVNTLVGPNATINLPQTGLYTINVQPGSQFLVETNPQFTRYSNFISSDYMLQKLSLNPQQTQQRLGDGFYEQQRVLDQITELTGRRYLADASDALDQYRALMNNAVQVAQQFNLSVGVALTPDQMANLTQDIVWLVSVNVDGHQVLEPVVYLSAADAKNLAANGATIAGKNVILTASGDITNNGSIAASQNAQLTASNLLNSGSISAGNDLSVTAAQNILNGGTLKAGGNVSLVAGGDVLSGVNVAQSLGAIQVNGLTSQLSPVALSNLSLPGSISASGSLSISAGRDLKLDTAPVTAGGNLSLAAGRDLTTTATAINAGGSAQLLAGRDLDLLATGTTTHVGTQRNGTESVTHTVSALQAAGGVTLLAGRDVTSQGAQVTGSTIALGAGHDINLQAATDTTTTSTDNFQHHTETSTGKSDQQVRGTTLTGSNGISLAAAHDLTITAGQLNSANGNVALSAGNNLTLAAAQEVHSSYVDTSTHQSSLFSSSSTHTHDATSDSNAVGTAISGNNVTLAAGNNLATEAAQLTANKALTLSAVNDVTLGAGENTHTEEHDYSHSSFNFFSDSSKRFGSVDPEWRSNQSSTTINQTNSVGSTLSGDTVTVAAGHDLTGTAVQVAGTHDVTLAAGNNLTLNAGKDTYTETQSSGTSHTGLMNGGGFSVLIGNKSTATTSTDKEVSYTGSLVGSTDGAVTLTAGNNVHITGSDVLSQTATNIVGKNVTIDAAVGSQDFTQTQKQSSAGISVGLTGGAATAAQTLAADVHGASASSSDSRLKALYAMQAAQTLFSPGAGNAMGLQGQTGAQALSSGSTQGISLRIGIGGGSSTSTGKTHDDAAYGSKISSTGDVNIAATGGDVNVIGSQIKGNNVALSATNNINLLSQAEQHTQSNNSHNASGEVGLSIGQTTGIYLSASAGESIAHGNGTTHTDSVVSAQNTLTMLSGNDTTIKGAQATGNSVLANIGGNLNVASEQDTNDYASHSIQGGITLVYGWGSSGGVGVSGNLAASKANSNYASVTQMSGIGAGNGGFNINVGGNTDLKGAAIASSASGEKNILDTGSLSFSDIQNHEKSSAESISVGGGMGTGGLSGMTGFSPGIGIPQNSNKSSTTQAGIAQGSVVVRDNPSQDLSGLNRNVSLGDANGLTNTLDPNKVAQNQQAGMLAGQVGMTAVGDISSYMANHASTDAEKKAWSDGGANKTLLHGLVGAATAALGGGDALQGALGAAASEKASAAMQQYLDDHNITDPVQRNLLMQLGSTAIGGVVGGGAGASTALSGELYNRELHVDETARLKQLEQGQSQEEIQKLQAAACALTHCADGVSTSDPNYQILMALQTLGSSDALISERDLLASQRDASGNFMFGYSFFNGGLSDWNGRNQASTRALGGLQMVGGSLETLGGGLMATTCETGIGCVAAMYIGGAGLDNAAAGANTMVTGRFTTTLGQQALQSLGLSPNAAAVIYGASQLVPAGVEAYTANASVNAWAASNQAAKLSYTSIEQFNAQGLQITSEIMQTPQAQAIYSQYVAAGVSPAKASEYTASLLQTGVDLPTSMNVGSDFELIKLVPKNASGGDAISGHSAYFVTRAQYDALSQLPPQQIANQLGLPAEQAIRGGQLGFDVYAMHPLPGTEQTVFTSEIAPVTQGGYSASGGAQQALIPNRSGWTDPNANKIGEISGGTSGH